jgi:hypothetical protein
MPVDTGKGRAGMRTVRFETAEAIFQFPVDDLIEVLKSHDSEDEATELMDFLKVQNSDVVDMPQDKKPFLYSILDLLASNKGSVFCKTCGRDYQASDLVSFPVGAGENPLKVKVGYRESPLKRLFGRQNRLPLFGGKGYRCPKRDEAIGVVTWRT